MARIAANRVKESTTTTGTGALTLSGALTAFRAFSAVMAVSDTCLYSLHAVDANGNPTGEWEVGMGTYSSANTLTRTTILSSSNAGAAVNLSAGTKHVWIDLPAERIPSFRGCLAYRTTDVVNPTLPYIVAFDAEEYDTDGIHDTATNNTRLTVPAGVSIIRLSASVELSAVAGGSYISFSKNGVTAGHVGVPASQVQQGTGFAGATLSVCSPPLRVVSGDYFELRYNNSSGPSGNTIEANNGRTWFAMEILA